ncbi:MAG: hypothetical protein ACRDX8_05140 [Acidimicrobiales bacterium]
MPRLLAVDPSGADAGVPAVLMCRLPGRIDWTPANLDLWLVRLPGLLPSIHTAPLPGPEILEFAEHSIGIGQQRTGILGGVLTLW